MKTTRLLVAILSTCALITACSKDKDDKGTPPKKVVEETTFDTLNEAQSTTLSVVDESGIAIPNAQILIGTALNTPFVDNFLSADAKGLLPLPKAWVNPEMVTISAPGYIRATFLEQRPQAQTYVLRLAPKADRFELKGKGTGFSVKDGDGLIDFAIMMPAMTKQDLFHFSVEQIMSPETDEISVLGQKADVPSNLSLPRQKETYILGFTLDKPAYRMYFDSFGTKNIYTVRGQFPHKPVIKGFQDKKKFTELINYFSIKGGSLRTADINGPSQNMDLPVNDLSFTQQQTFTSPNFSGNEAMISVAVSEFQQLMLPTDFKNVQPNQSVSLVTAAGSTPQLLNVLMNKPADNKPRDERISAALYTFNKSIKAEFLPLMDYPQVTNKTQVSLKAIAPHPAITPHATYCLLSKVTERSTGRKNESYKSTSALWEVYAAGWSTGFNLPTWPNEGPMQGSLRWEASYLGTQGTKKLDLSARLFEPVTHATHSSVDF